MKLCIKQRVFSWGDTYDIYDENGNEKYLVKEEIFTFGHVEEDISTFFSLYFALTSFSGTTSILEGFS